MSHDYLGREECRTFVLNENNEIADLFGSASIEGWLQLQLSTQVFASFISHGNYLELWP